MMGRLTWKSVESGVAGQCGEDRDLCLQSPANIDISGSMHSCIQTVHSSHYTSVLDLSRYGFAMCRPLYVFPINHIFKSSSRLSRIEEQASLHQPPYFNQPGQSQNPSPYHGGPFFLNPNTNPNTSAKIRIISTTIPKHHHLSFLAVLACLIPVSSC